MAKIAVKGDNRFLTSFFPYRSAGLESRFGRDNPTSVVSSSSFYVCFLAKEMVKGSRKSHLEELGHQKSLLESSQLEPLGVERWILPMGKPKVKPQCDNELSDSE